MTGDRPLCECCGIPMLWQAVKTHRAGGRWVCREKRKQWNKNRSAQRVAWMRKARAENPHHYWVTARRRFLALTRERIKQQLSRLSEEAESLESQS